MCYVLGWHCIQCATCLDGTVFSMLHATCYVLGVLQRYVHGDCGGDSWADSPSSKGMYPWLPTLSHPALVFQQKHAPCVSV